MSSLNKAIIIGRLGKDPDVHDLPEGGKIVNISVATSDRWTDKATGEKKESVEWHKVVFFKKLADIAANHLKSGTLVYLEGKLKTRQWEDKEGRPRSTTEVIANNLQMLSSKSDAAPATDKEFDF